MRFWEEILIQIGQVWLSAIMENIFNDSILKP